MSGPQYPPSPVAGSNAIGLGAIGVMQIGDIPAFDLWQTVLQQYANSDILTAIIQDFFAAADQTENFSAFFDDIWNVNTAQGYGLDVWGRIVGVSRVVQVASTSWFGFAEALPGALSFNTGANIQQGGGSFYSGASLTNNYFLSDESYRRLILAKAAFNISNCSIPAINKILQQLFPGRGNCFVTDGYQGSSYFGFTESQNAQTFGQGAFYNGQTVQGMVMTYTFEFPLSLVELAIVGQSGVLPKPTGVLASVVINT